MKGRFGYIKSKLLENKNFISRVHCTTLDSNITHILDIYENELIFSVCGHRFKMDEINIGTKTETKCKRCNYIPKW